MQPEQASTAPELGVRATVVMDGETWGPTALHEGEGLRKIALFRGPSEDSFSEEGYRALQQAGVDSMVLPMDSTRMEEPLVDEIHIVSTYTLHTALYALQNPTVDNIARALYLIGVSGDCEGHVDSDTLLPKPVPAPRGF